MNNQEFIKRLIKYSLEGLAVAIAAVAIPRRSMDSEEIVSIALTAAATFAILDALAPSIAVGARQGAGFGLGFKMSGNSLSSMIPTAAPPTIVPAGATP